MLIYVNYREIITNKVVNNFPTKSALFLQPQRVVSSFVPTLMPRPNQPHWILIFLILNSFSDFSYALRLVISPTPDPSASDAPAVSANSTLLQENSERTLVLKTYPDGTKKIVPLAALNFR